MSKFPDGVFQYGGMPVGGGRYEAMWGNTVYFVDYDNGAEGNGGTSPGSACKYLDTALGKATEWDVIYVRPRDPDSAGGDPQSVLPLSTTANYIIPYTLHGLSIIGTGVGENAAYSTRIQGASGVTTATILVNAPFVNIENLCIRKGSSTAGSLKFFADASTGFTFGASASNCHFRLGGTTATTAGAVVVESAWYTVINGCTFSACPVGIGIGASQAVPQETVIKNCIFNGGASAIDADVVSSGAVTRIVINGCVFDHAVPAETSGTAKRYVKFAAASTGLVSNCATGAVDPTVADNMTLNGVLYSNIWGDGVGPFVDA